MNVSEELVRQIVQKILEESAAQNTPKEDFVKEKDPSGIIKIKTDTVKCERFQQDGVALKDVVTLEEAPRMGCGIMELDHTSFEWTLTYSYPFPDSFYCQIRLFCISGRLAVRPAAAGRRKGD